MKQLLAVISACWILLAYKPVDSKLNPDFQDDMISFEINSDMNIEHKIVLDFDENIIKDRLAQLYSPIELDYSSRVRGYINEYVKHKSTSAKILAKKDVYFPIIEEAIKKYGLPKELAALAVVESKLNPLINSSSGATGLWQIMPAIGRNYGLVVNDHIDERRDPAKASKVAAKLLVDLYKRYDNWHLAIAAYNCGSVQMNKAIRKAGGVQKWSAVKRYLPTQTQKYLPKFIAATYLVNYYYLHEIQPEWYYKDYSYSNIITIDRKTNLEDIAYQFGVKSKDILRVNPALMSIILPEPEIPVELKIPFATALK